MKKNLDNSRRFDAFWWSTIPEIKGSADFICRNIPADRLSGYKLNRLKNTLKVILTNLYLAQKHDPKMYVAVSMNKNSYQGHRRYKSLYLNYNYLKFLVDYLKEKGYLEFHRGINYGNFARCSRIKATQKLLRLLRKYREDGGVTIRRTLPVLLRNEHKKDIDFDPNADEVRRMIQNLNKINKCLARHDVDVMFNFNREPGVLEADLEKYKACQKYTRIFNNSSFEEGGRFHGHWSQYIKSCFRPDITIDGDCTVELDYSCLHIFMLYCLEGIQPPAGDLYNLKGISPVFRSLIKIAVNIALNAENETKAKQAILQEINNIKKDFPDTFFPSPTIIITAIRSTHPLISKYLCTGMGIKLQNMDSQIAEKILLYFAERDICCLSIHDSFIISHKYEATLHMLMTKYFFDKFHYKPRISKKSNSVSKFDSLEEIISGTDIAA